MPYVINPSSAVVHTSECNWGPTNPRSTVSGYEQLPSVTLAYLPTELFCAHCCSHIIKARAAAVAA